ncbi:hypothetical protein GALMADRAFT_258045 [Galerina marginata CBS 339.88]|uniref:Uncharacterized protein n=1 Tax=Galerina marginata (strain CBS 339.88) TaxID=685588 RepID=A0A067S9G3_GALM3|nr:hypothetical protein GALMADRAFT_258045 [Galerina marginata CBS 339.88]
MSKIAAEGTKVANRSANEFGEVHSTVNSLIRTYGVKKSKKAELANNIEVLEKLGDSVKAYAKWWNQMHMLQTSTERRLQAGYGALRKKALEVKWVELKGEYEQYTAKIRGVEADYPTIFSPEFRARTIEGARRLDLKTMTLGQKIKILWGS